MKKMILFMMAVAVVALVVPGTASASYNISKAEAKWSAADAAEHKYAGNGVYVEAARCRPQGSRRSFYATFGRHHRWVCVWVGYDADDADVYGTFRITGHSDGTYGYVALLGGLRWS